MSKVKKTGHLPVRSLKWRRHRIQSHVKLVSYNLDMTAVDKKNLDQNRAFGKFLAVDRMTKSD